MPAVRKITAPAAVLALLVLLTACGEATRDADVGDRVRGSADIIEMPDGFRNVASKCDGPNRVYSASRGNSEIAGAIAVVANDPRCTKAGPSAP